MLRSPATACSRPHAPPCPRSTRRASALQWNPEIATQLVVASDDDRSPTLQMWDLRNSVSPLKEFVGHTKGVLSMAWSDHDPTLLLSSAKDNRTICWDVNTADILCELPASSNWNFDVQWCPSVPGVFSTASFDGHVAVHNLHSCTLSKVTETVNADFTVTHESTGETVPLRKAPQWMRRPVGATFGFGGKLVTFNNHKVQATDATGQVVQRDQCVLTLSQVVTEQDLVQRSEQFEQAIAGGEKPTLQAFCKDKTGTVSGEGEEAETWSFLSLLFEVDGRRELLRKLGFEAEISAQEAAAAAAAAQAAAAANGGAVEAVAQGVEAVQLAPTPSMGGGAPEDFFNEARDDDPDFFDKLPDEVGGCRGRRWGQGAGLQGRGPAFGIPLSLFYAGVCVHTPVSLRTQMVRPHPHGHTGDDVHVCAQGIMAGVPQPAPDKVAEVSGDKAVEDDTHLFDGALADASQEHEEEVQRAMIAGVGRTGVGGDGCGLRQSGGVGFCLWSSWGGAAQRQAQWAGDPCASGTWASQLEHREEQAGQL